MEARAQHEQAIAPGTLVDHFQVKRLVGQGGMGEVYLARDTKLGRKVALKLIHPERLVTPQAIDRFVLEARLTARFNHPHIVTIFGVGNYSGRPYVALEFLEGQSLQQRMDEQQPSVKESLRYALAIAEALTEAHRNGVLHRDLKPDNAVIAEDGRLRVVDFGVAKLLGPSGHEALADLEEDPPPLAHGARHRPLTQTGTMWGTPAYMAPEQWATQKSTSATDIWALGVILYELLTGRLPFDASTVTGLASQVVGPKEAPSLPALSEAPVELSELVGRCLAKQPGKRPSADQVVDALKRMVTDGAVRLTSEQSPYRGLLPFAEQHAGLFFGREGEIGELLERMRQEPVLPVVGPSGAGKTSFVQAGIIPRLREGGPWVVLQLRPGPRPFHALAARLRMAPSLTTTAGFDSVPPPGPASVPPSGPGSVPSSGRGPQATVPSGAAARAAQQGRDEALQADLGTLADQGSSVTVADDMLAQQLRETPTQLYLMLQRIAEHAGAKVLLFVDQLEELYTLVDDEEVRRSFMEAISSAADDPLDPVSVIFTLRDDFLGRLAEGARARAVLSRLMVIRTPVAETLGDILVKPLGRVGYCFEEPRMADEMLAEVAGEAASLPLLQFACQMLWERRDKQARLLRRSAYDAMGGVAGALAAHADGVLGGLSAAQVLLAREMLIRMVTLQGTRRVLSRSELLEGLPGAAVEVLDRLTGARLVQARKARSGERGETMFELVHESLVRSWQRLARWLAEAREELAFLEEVGQAAELWDKRGRRESEVWHGEALAEALRDMERCPGGVPVLVAAFLRAGQRRQRRLARRRRALALSGIGLLAAATVGSVALALAFADQKREVAAQRDEAGRRWVEARREGARAAVLRGDWVEARAKLRGLLESEDSSLARGLWWRLSRSSVLWTKQVGAVVYDVAISPDGSTVAAACHDRAVHLLDTRTLATRVLRGHTDQVLALAFSPDGTRLASGSRAGRIVVWDAHSGAEQASLVGHESGVSKLLFHPDGKRLLSSSWDRTIIVWTLGTDAKPRVLEGHRDRIDGLALSPDGERIASGGADRTVRIWDLATGSPVQTLTGHEDRITSLSFSSDGQLVASASADRTIRLWGVSQGAEERVLRGAKDVIETVAFHPKDQVLAAGEHDGSVRLWDVAHAEPIRVLKGHGAMVRSVAFSSDGGRLVSGGQDTTVRLWDTASRESRVGKGPHTMATTGVATSPDSRRVASASLDGTIRIWDVRTGEVQRVLEGHTAAVEPLAFSPDGRVLASGSVDQTIRLWDLAGDDPPRLLAGHSGGVLALAFSPDGHLLASGGRDRTVRIWHVPSGRPLRVLRGHGDAVSGVAFRSDTLVVASASFDKTLRTWDVGTGGRMQVLHGHRGALHGVAFDRDDKQLVSGSGDGAVRLWEIEGETVRVVGQHDGRVYAAAFHPDGLRVGAASADGTARIWDTRSDQSLVLQGHRGEVHGIDFTPDGAFAVTTGDDGTVRLWDASTGRSHWRCPVLIHEPWAMFTHRGWVGLGPGSPGAPALGAADWRKAVEDRARVAALASDGSTLCAYTSEGQLELWDTGQDRRLVDRAVEPVASLEALPGHCVTRTGKRVQVVPADGEPVSLAEDATALALDGDEHIMIANRKRQVLLFEPTGKQTARVAADRDVTAMARAGSWLALGFDNGNIELVPVRADEERRSAAFEQTPSSPVVRMLSGPRDTIIAGYANGLLGVWTLDGGVQLDHEQLHGPVAHLALQAGKLYAATELGDHRVLDLSSFHLEYCELLRRIWQEVPVVWEGGTAVLRSAASGHRCAAR